MAYGIPDTCPKCGSRRVDKERIMGAQTGDWVCGECKATGPINREPQNKKKDTENK